MKKLGEGRTLEWRTEWKNVEMEKKKNLQSQYTYIGAHVAYTQPVSPGALNNSPQLGPVERPAGVAERWMVVRRRAEGVGCDAGAGADVEGPIKYSHVPQRERS